ncbi:extracellular solute-binding protein [Paenibacillus sp. 1P07SE]|uniref:extracellular solute-binding protein n=1 Tax=Paenibacillus sp. 1P07SE TaxID=3132209 RepID=UPI0039A704C9
MRTPSKPRTAQWLLMLLILSLCVGAAAPAAASAAPLTITLNGEKLLFSEPPIIREGITYAPADDLLRALGLDGQQRELDISSFNHSDTLYIPVRITAATAKLEVIWRPELRQIDLFSSPELTPLRVFVPLTEDYTAAQLQAIEAYGAAVSGVKLILEQTSYDRYVDRMRLKIAAGDPSDLMLLPDASQIPSHIYPLASQDIRPYLDQYPLLAQLSPAALQELRDDDGGLYALPIPISPASGSFPALRQDWLDALDLKAPSTMEELKQTIKQFTERDPDGNGRNDTYGLSAIPGAEGLEGFEWVDRIFNNSSSRFQVVDGVVTDTMTGEGTREALAWLQEAYRNGWLHPEWATLSAEAAKQQVRRGVTGGAALTLEEVAELEMTWHDDESKATLLPLTSLQADASSPAVTAQGKNYEGILLFSYRTEPDKMGQLMSLLEGLMSTDTTVETEDVYEGRMLLKQALQFPAATEFTAELSEEKREQLTIVREQREALVTTQGALVSPLDLLKDSLTAYARVTRQLQEMRTKVIMGTSLNEWDTFIAKLQDSDDYIRMMEALNE